VVPIFLIFITQAITKHLWNSPLGAIFYTHTTHTSTLTQAFDHTGQWYWKCRWDVRKATTLPKSTLLWSIKIHILLFIEKKEVTCFLLARNETRFVIFRASFFVPEAFWISVALNFQHSCNLKLWITEYFDRAEVASMRRNQKSIFSSHPFFILWPQQLTAAKTFHPGLSNRSIYLQSVCQRTFPSHFLHIIQCTVTNLWSISNRRFRWSHMLALNACSHAAVSFNTFVYFKSRTNSSA
jgi:hypothetical protein